MEQFIKALFRDVIESKDYDETSIHHYFSKDYIQIVDGQILDFEEFKKHIQKLKTLMKKMKVRFLNIASNETSVFTKHIVEIIFKNGTSAKHKVFAEFQVKDGKVVQCDELTILTGGDESQSGLGAAV